MEMIKIPHTDLEVSRLALGCMGLGGGWEADVQLTKDHLRQAREFLDTAEEIGANFFDHANIYGRGRAEEIFGRVLMERPSLRDKMSENRVSQGRLSGALGHHKLQMDSVVRVSENRYNLPRNR